MQFKVEYIGTEPFLPAPAQPGEVFFVCRAIGAKPADIEKMTKTFQDLQKALVDGKITPEEAIVIIGDLMGANLNIPGITNLFLVVTQALKDGKISWYEGLMIAMAIPGAL